MPVSPPTFPLPTLSVRPWPDVVIDQVGHDPRSPYVEQFWLGLLGPTACDFAVADMRDFAFRCQRVQFRAADIPAIEGVAQTAVARPQASGGVPKANFFLLSVRMLRCRVPVGDLRPPVTCPEVPRGPWRAAANQRLSEMPGPAWTILRAPT